MKTLLALILIVVLAGGAYLYFTSDRGREAGRRAADATQPLKDTAEQLKDSAVHVTDAVKEKLKGVSLNTPEIKEELERTGKVVRKKAEQVGTVIADATADARITGAIKAKLVKDPTLSALKISVNTTDGVVTLSGSVGSAEEVSQALKLALETDGVREAISTLQVKAAR